MSLAHVVLEVVTPKMAEKRAITVEFIVRLLDTWYKSSRMMKHSLELSRLFRLRHQISFGQRLVTHHCAWQLCPFAISNLILGGEVLGIKALFGFRYLAGFFRFVC